MTQRLEIEQAAQRLATHVRRTPSLMLDEPVGAWSGATTFKLEFLQHSGSFKARGAFNRLLQSGRAGQAVVAASGGNHGAAVAFAAQKLGFAATIFVPRATPAAKLDRIASYGASTVPVGDTYAEAYAASQAWAAERDALEVHAYDDEAVLAGQGTIGRELEADDPALTHVLIAVGGGGLIGGVGSWFAGTGVRVVGVEPDGCPALHNALAAGRPVPGPVGGLAADSLGARQVGSLMFAVAQRAGLQSVLVSDAEIRAAQVWLWQRLRIVSEPGGATALAPLLSGTWSPPAGSKVGVVLCGANTNPSVLES